MIELRVARAEVPLGSLSFSELGLGRYPRKAEARFELKVDGYDFCTRFGPTYSLAIRELTEDDRIVGKFQPPFDGASRYPTFEEWLDIPEPSRLEMIDTFFTYDILRLYLAEDNPRAEWVVNSLDTMRRETGSLLLGGDAIRWPANS